MKTVAFYSYKGGTGRTLALANVAAFAALAGKRVVVVDMDLEAPGAAYKFSATYSDGSRSPRGLVGYLLDAVRTGSIPRSLRPYSIEVPVHASIAAAPRDASLWLVPAGTAPAASYFGELKRLQLDARSADGSATELLQATLRAIGEEFGPDLILIDARTGITDTNSLVLAELASDLFAFYVDLPEQRDGVRNVLRSLAPLASEGRPSLNVVIARTAVEPAHIDAGWVETDSDLARMRASAMFMQEPTSPLENTVGQLGVYQLHHYDGLISQESLLLTQLESTGVSAQPLAWDYARLAREVVGDEAAVGAIAASLARSHLLGASAAAAVVTGHPELRAADEDVAVSPAITHHETNLLDQLERARAMARQDPASLPALAETLLKVSAAEAELGRAEPAAEAAREAVEILRRLDTRGVSSRVSRARALLAAAGRLIELDPDEARVAALSAISLLDKLSPQRRTVQADLAGAFMLLSRIPGDPAGVETNLRNAIRILRDLSEASQKHLATLATALIDLSVVYASRGRGEDALGTAIEAADAARSAFARSAKNVLVSAEALNNVAIRSAEMGQLNRSTSYLLEAESQLRRAGRTDPVQALLAKVLNNRSLVLRLGGDESAALRALEESVSIYRKLSLGDSANRTRFVRALTNQATELARLGRSTEAKAVLEEAVAVGREGDGDDARHYALAVALIETARLEDDFGEYASALSANEEAIALLRDLIGTTPAATAALSSALTNLSATLSAVGRHEGSVAVAEEAVTLAEEAVTLAEGTDQKDPEHRKLLASALINVGLAKMATGDDTDDALRSIERAVHQFSEIETLDSSVAGPLANALNTLAVGLLARGRKAEALEHSARAVSTAARAAERVPGELPGYANSLNSYGAILRQLDRLDEAFAQCARAVDIYRRLSEQSSAYTRELSNALDELAEIERLRGNHATSKAYADEAARLNPNRRHNSNTANDE